MSKALTVRELRDALEVLVAEGHGAVPVLNGGNGVKRPKVVGKAATYIGPSEWDHQTYTLGDEGSGFTVLL